MICCQILNHLGSNKFLRKRPQQLISTKHKNKPNNENLSRQNQSAFSERWDNLEMFLKKKREEKLIKLHLPPEPTKKLEFVKIFPLQEILAILERVFPSLGKDCNIPFKREIF